jgi:molecular chaperone GrpE (heat shock protein)
MALGTSRPHPGSWRESSNMLTWLRKWLGKASPGKLPEGERLLALEREAQMLRLELTEREKILANLEATVERQRNDESRRINETVQAQIERLVSEAATPLTQLLTQAHLLEVAGKPLQAKDVLAVAKRLIRVLEESGLKLESAIGEALPFDPNRHEPLSADTIIKLDQTVTIRFAGVSYRGKLLRKAKVELCPDA